MLSRVADSGFVRVVLIYSLFVFFAIILGWLLQPVLLPLAIACILYILLHPMVVNLEGRGINSNISISIVLLMLLVLTIGSVIILIPLLIDQIQQLQDRLPLLWDKTSLFIDNFSKTIQDNLGISFNTQTVVQRVLANIQSSGAAIVLSSAGIMMQITMAIFLVPLITFFLLRDFHSIRNNLMSWLPNRRFELGWLIYHGVTQQMQNYLRGVMIQSTIIAIFASIGFYFINLEMAFLFGILTGLFNLIPYVGPPMAMIAPLIVSLGAEQVDTITLIGIPMVILAAQLIDNLIIVPTLIANTVNLHPLMVLLGIIVFGAFFGFIGMLVAIPVMAISKIVFTSLINGLSVKEISV